MNGEGSTQSRTKETSIRRGIGLLINMLVSHHIPSRVSCPKITNRNGGQRIVFVVRFFLFLSVFAQVVLVGATERRPDKHLSTCHSTGTAAAVARWEAITQLKRETAASRSLSVNRYLYPRAYMSQSAMCRRPPQSRCVLLRLMADCTDSLVDAYSKAKKYKHQTLHLTAPSIKTGLIDWLLCDQL